MIDILSMDEDTFLELAKAVKRRTVLLFNELDSSLSKHVVDCADCNHGMCGPTRALTPRCDVYKQLSKRWNKFRQALE